MLFPTTIVGSYPQPDWLIDREKLAGRFPPRVRAKELWRVAEPYLQQAMEDATLIAIRGQEQAGLDIITDGEIRRESYSNRIATALEGIDIELGSIEEVAPLHYLVTANWKMAFARGKSGRVTSAFPATYVVKVSGKPEILAHLSRESEEAVMRRNGVI